MSNYVSVVLRNRKKVLPPSLARLIHNARLGKLPWYLLPPHLRSQNMHIIPVSNATQKWKKWVRENERRYADAHNGRKLRDDAFRLEEALIVLSEEQVAKCDPEGIGEAAKLFASWFEQRFNTIVRTLDWHRDEGVVLDADGKKIDIAPSEELPPGAVVQKNEHIHFFFDDVGLDGQKVRRNMSRQDLREMQSAAAEIFGPLGFQRGAPTPAGQKKKKNKHPKEWVAEKKKEEKEREQLATIKRLKEEIAGLRVEMQQVGAIREDYAELEAKNRELREQIKEKEITVSELTEKIGGLRAELTEQIQARKEAEETARRRGLALVKIKKVVRAEDRADWQEAKSEDERVQIIANSVVEMRSELSERESELQEAQTTIEELKAVNEGMRENIDIYERWIDRVASLIRGIAGRFGLFGDGDDAEVAVDLLEALDDETSEKRSPSKTVNRSQKIKL